MKKKSIIFVASSTKDILFGFCLCSFFIATYSAINAANIGYQTLVDCCASEAGNCSLSRIGGDSLSYFTLIFRSQMTKNNENASNAQGAITSRLTNEEVFSFEGTQEVRVIIINGNPWFIAQDVCLVLGLGNTSWSVNRLDDDEKGITINDTLGGNQKMLTVSESGLYALIFQSRKPIAKKFRKWVTSEVLPSIRKTGMYATKESAGKLTGHWVQVTGADDNLYLHFILKAVCEFIEEEAKGYLDSPCVLRLTKKFEAARTLCPEYRKNLRNINVKVS